MSQAARSIMDSEARIYNKTEEVLKILSGLSFEEVTRVLDQVRYNAKQNCILTPPKVGQTTQSNQAVQDICSHTNVIEHQGGQIGECSHCGKRIWG